MCGEAARAGVASEDGEDAGECAEPLAEHAAGGRSGGIGGIGGGKGGAKAVGEHKSAEFVVPVDGFDRVFEGTVSIPGGRNGEGERESNG